MTRKVLLASAAAIHNVWAPQPQRPDTVPEKLSRAAARPREGGARRRQSHGARRDTGGDEENAEGEDADDDGEPNLSIPDPQVCREFGVSAMTLWRWDRDPDRTFPRGSSSVVATTAAGGRSSGSRRASCAAPSRSARARRAGERPWPTKRCGPGIGRKSIEELNALLDALDPENASAVRRASNNSR